MPLLARKNISSGSGLLRRAEQFRQEAARVRRVRRERRVLTAVGASAVLSMGFAIAVLFTKDIHPAALTPQVNQALEQAAAELNIFKQEYSAEELLSELRQTVCSAVNSHTPRAALLQITVAAAQGREYFPDDSAALREIESYEADAQMLLRENVSDLCPAVDYARIDEFIQEYNWLSDSDRELVKTFGALYCRIYNLDPYIFFGLLARESSFRLDAVSNAGAKGLGQIMPANFDTLDVENPYDIQQNLRAAASHLRGMFDYWADFPKHQLVLGLASYHSGTGNIRKTITRGVFNPAKLTPLTRDYVNDIIAFSNRLKTQK